MDSVQNIKVVLKSLDKDAPGFLPRWRQILALKRSVTDIAKAQPEDVDEAMKLLEAHIVEPSEPQAKRNILNMASGEEFSAMFEQVLGMNSVPPPNGAPSGS